MKHFSQEVAMPTANLTINKSRLKVYNKKADIPTYYLKKGQEFQIELFNPTTDIVLARIKLNNNSISQGGLVLRPGERVFLERYLDVAKKFKFDTYEVSGKNEEVERAIKENGDFSVQFYKERQIIDYPHITLSGNGNWDRDIWGGPNTGGWNGGVTYDSSFTHTVNLADNDSNLGVEGTLTTTAGMATLDMMDVSASVNSVQPMGFMDTTLSREIPNHFSHTEKKVEPKSFLRKKSKTKTVETGRVEKGSASNQTIETVHYDFETYPFYTVEYKMLPESRKINTSKDIKTRKYCTNCGKKQKATNKFCANCGSKQ